MGTAARHGQCNGLRTRGTSAGRGFTQYTAKLEAGGTLGSAVGSRFVFVMEGSLQFTAGDRHATLGVGGYCYIPQAFAHTLTADTAGARAAVIEKPLHPRLMALLYQTRLSPVKAAFRAHR